MKKIYLAVIAAALLLPVLASAQSPFDGTWRVNMNNVDWPKKPDVYLLQNGMYQCKTCVPLVDIKADGEDQKVSGHPYIDTMSVKVINDHEIQETDKRNGKVVETSTITVSPDGSTMTVEFTDSSNTNGAPVTGRAEATRVAKGPAGSNAISGSWRTTKVENISSNAITWTYKVNGDELTMTNPTGQSYTAKLDGTEAPMKGDPGVTTVSVKKLGKNTIEETDLRDGKVISVVKMTVEPGGKTANLVAEDKLHGTTTRFTATKQ